MYRKCLIAIGAVVLCMSTLYADPTWPVTVSNGYHWAEKTATVGVQLKIEPWAKITPTGSLAITETEPDSGIWEGCIELELRRNFASITVHADITWIHADVAGIWSISLTEGAGSPAYVSGTHVVTPVTHFEMGSPDILELCVTVSNLDWSDFNGGETLTVATVSITMYVDNVTPVGDQLDLGVGATVPGAE